MLVLILDDMYSYVEIAKFLRACDFIPFMGQKSFIPKWDSKRLDHDIVLINRQRHTSIIVHYDDQPY